MERRFELFPTDEVFLPQGRLYVPLGDIHLRIRTEY